jgi:hypothetical protein
VSGCLEGVQVVVCVIADRNQVECARGREG